MDPIAKACLSFATIYLRSSYGYFLELKSLCAFIYQYRPPFFRLPSIATVSFSNCHLFVGRFFLCSDCRRAIVHQPNRMLASCSTFPWGVRLHPVRASLSFHKKRIWVDRCVYCITPEADRNFYHWMKGCLSRMQIVREHDIDFFSSIALVLHSSPATYEAQSLRLGCFAGQNTK